MEQGLFDADYVKAFGAELFQAIFSGPIKDVYDGSRQSGAPLRFRLIIDAPALARIPWELLYDPERKVFLSLEGPFVRGASLTIATRPLEVKPPLRILVLDAFPKGVPKLQNQVETNGIRQALASLIRLRRVEVRTLPHATLGKLQNALREAVTPEHPRPFHLLHFIGHGQHDPASGRTVLLFEDEQGQIDEVDAETLLNIVRPYDLKLVFLNACQSAHASALDISQGFAPALLASGVPAVIGMQVTVLDAVAVQFSRDFYTALADNKPVDAALADARQLARGSRRRRKADMGIPVCYLRTETGQILEIEPAMPTRLTPTTVWPWLREQSAPRRILAGLLSIITLASTLLGLYWGIVAFFPAPPLTTTPLPVMSKDFNVAITPFAQLDAQNNVVDSAEAVQLSNQVYETLATELNALKKQAALAGFEIEIRAPSDSGPISGATPEARAQAAQKLAEEIKADMVIYGYLISDNTTLAPEFYLSDRQLQSAEELAGQYKLGAEVNVRDDITRNPVARRYLREQLIGRTVVLARFVIGLGYFALDRFDEAARQFEAAERTPGWDERSGKEVLYLFLGSTAGRLRNLASAQAYYAHALQLNPEYARARLGAAEVVFQQSMARCDSGHADIAGLQKAIAGYRSALTAADKPIQSNITTKTAYSLGRVYLCLGHAGDRARWADAEGEFLRVTAEFEGGNTQVRNFAAESYANLGLIAFLTASAPEIEPAYRRAAEQYHKAIELSRHHDRQAIFYLWLARIELRLGNCAAASTAIASADQAFAGVAFPLPNYAPFREEIQRERAEASC
jgi:tetratricopeptide (TPR) repeat protein